MRITIELRRPARRSIAVLLGLLLVAAPAVVFASHQFSDVPDSHPFHSEIDWLAQKRITTGFNDGTYRPTNAVTRQAMAAFLRRVGTGMPMEVEPNGSLASADIYPPAGPAMGGILGFDYDYWRLSHPGGNLVAETIALDCFTLGAGDTFLTLFDNSGTVLFENDDIGGNPINLCSRITANGLAAGDYVLRVRSFGGSRVPWYGLMVFVDGSPLTAPGAVPAAPQFVNEVKR